MRVGVTRYPAGVGLKDPSEIGVDLLEPCANLRMGTALFGKVWRIVVKWYGAAVPEAFDDAILAWRTGTFEGRAVFLELDPGPLKGTDQDRRQSAGDEDGRPPPDKSVVRAETSREFRSSDPRRIDEDPRRAEMRIDLSGAGRDRKP